MILFITAISVVAILLCLVTFIGSFFVEPERIENEGTSMERRVGTPSSISSFLSKKVSLIMLVFALCGFGLQSSIYYAERGTYYEIIYPNGDKAAEFDEGFHLVVPFTKVNPWSAFIDVKAGNIETMSADIEGKMAAIGVTFVDQVGANISSAFRFELPRDEETFLELAVKYRSIANLTENTLKPTVAEQAKLTSKMFSAQDYISGSSQAFRQTFEEQLKGGTYVVKKTTSRDTTFFADIQNSGDRKIKDISISYHVSKVLENGKPKRIANEISASGIIVSQVIVEDVDVDKAYKKRLVAQKAESATRQLEQQKIETAKIAQQRIKAEGERDKEAERVEQEKNQVKKLIAIETKLKEEATNLKLAEIQLQTEKKLAEQEKVKADAKAYKNRKLVSAGLTPQEKAEYALKEKIGIAEATAKMATPEVVIINGGKNSGGNDLTNSLIQAEMAKNLINKKK